MPEGLTLPGRSGPLPSLAGSWAWKGLDVLEVERVEDEQEREDVVDVVEQGGGAGGLCMLCVCSRPGLELTHFLFLTKT